MATADAVARPALAGRTVPIRVYLALVGGVLCIGFTAIFTKWAGMPGPIAASYRMLTAAVVLSVPFALRIRRGVRFPQRSVGLAVGGGLVFALNLGLLNSALLLTSAATATLLDNMAPVWVGIGAMLLFHERLGRKYWAGLVLALAGAGIVTGLNPGSLASFNPGDLIAFVGGMFYAAYLLVTQRAREDMDALAYLWLVVATAALALLGASLVMRLPLAGYPSHSYWAMIGAGLISQTGGWLLINYSLGYLPASNAVIILLGQPIVTALLSVPLLGETIGWRQTAGGALVLAAVYLCIARGSGKTKGAG